MTQYTMCHMATKPAISMKTSTGLWRQQSLCNQKHKKIPITGGKSSPCDTMYIVSHKSPQLHNAKLNFCRFSFVYVYTCKHCLLGTTLNCLCRFAMFMRYTAASRNQYRREKRDFLQILFCLRIQPLTYTFGKQSLGNHQKLSISISQATAEVNS